MPPNLTHKIDLIADLEPIGARRHARIQMYEGARFAEL